MFSEYETILDIGSNWFYLCCAWIKPQNTYPFLTEKETSYQISKCWNSEDFDILWKGQRFKGKLFLHGRIHHVSKSGKQTTPRSIYLLYYFKIPSWSLCFCIRITENKYLQWQSKSLYDFAWIRSGITFISRKAVRTKNVY